MLSPSAASPSLPKLCGRLLLLFSTCVAIHAQPVHAQPGGRRAWTKSRILGSPTPPPPYRVQRVFQNLSFNNPTVLTNCPDSDRLYVAEVKGAIYSFPNRADVETADLAIDIGKSIPGAKQVYGLTFHPRFSDNRYCYICYVLDADLDDGTRLSRFRVADTDPPTISIASETIMLTWKSGGHNGGCLKFGPDGFLYVSAGDAGPAFPPDPLKSGQDISNVRSTIMRIDVDRAGENRPYSIPNDNPFVKTPAARGEVWAYGFRNPWKMSFDSATGDLWVGDVGWELWEMVYRVEKSGNYGWSLVEGSQPVHRERSRGPTPIIKPTVEHSHTESRSVTGGFVYRGERLSDLVGDYVYGDYVTGKIWALRYANGKVQQLREIAETQMPIICFGVDNREELYVVSYEGQIFRIEKNLAAASSSAFPRRLSETGLFGSVKDHRLAPGVQAYEIVAPMWQDGAVSERFVAMPGTDAIGRWTANNTGRGEFRGEWRLPENSVLGKTIRLPSGSHAEAPPGRRVETQILHYRDGLWHPYTYVWNDEQTDAKLLEGEGRTISYSVYDKRADSKETRQWRVAGRNECLLCHTTRSGSVQAFHLAQLERTLTANGRSVEQLEHLTRLGFFSATPQRAKKTKPYASPYDDTASLEDRARAYLHVNCAHCHRRGGGGTASMDVVFKNQLEKTNLLGERPTQGAFGLHGPRVIAAGEPMRSVLLYRMAKSGRGRMPYFGSAVADSRGVLLMRDWIASLKAEDSIEVAMRRERDKVIESTLAALNDQSPDTRQSSIDSLLTTTSGALQLAIALHEQPLSPDSRQMAIDRASKLDDPAKRDLFEAYFPESLRRKRLGDSVDVAQILALKGNLSRGRQLFEKSAGLQCRNCHQAQGVGKNVGPDLTKLGDKQTKAELLESILSPSKRIDPKYVTYLIELLDGRVLNGLLVEQSKSGLVIQDATGKQIQIDRSQIEFSGPQRKSLMPDLQLRESTPQEVADLLEYLKSI